MSRMMKKVCVLVVFLVLCVFVLLVVCCELECCCCLDYVRTRALRKEGLLFLCFFVLRFLLLFWCVKLNDSVFVVSVFYSV